MYLSGLGAVLFGYVIVVTTFDWVRRNKFTIFFWAHYSFIGYFALAYMHTRYARPFLLVGIALYALDRLLRVVWMWLPRRTLMFRLRGDNIAQVACRPHRAHASSIAPLIMFLAVASFIGWPSSPYIWLALGLFAAVAASVVVVVVVMVSSATRACVWIGAISQESHHSSLWSAQGRPVLLRQLSAPIAH